MANSSSKQKLGLASLNIAADAKSHYSKKSLTKSDLSQYFSQGQKQIQEDAKSRISEISKGSFRAKALKRLEEQKVAQSAERIPETVAEEAPVEEITYESDKNLEDENNQENA